MGRASGWRRSGAVSRDSGPAGAVDEVIDHLLGFWKMPRFAAFPFFRGLRQLFSPYRLNPLNINPLRGLLESLVDFSAVQKSRTLKLFISATNVRTGKIKVFSGGEITADAIMASACLPYALPGGRDRRRGLLGRRLHGQPGALPVLRRTGISEDILLIQVNPVRREEVPKTADEIMERISEITFNSSLLREFRAIDFVNRLMDENRIDPKHYRRNRLHRIDATSALRDYTAATKLDTSWSFFRELHKAGHAAAKAWLTRHFDDIGVKATVDLRAEFMYR